MVLYDKNRPSDRARDLEEELEEAVEERIERPEPHPHPHPEREWRADDGWAATVVSGDEERLERVARRRIRLGWMAGAINGVLVIVPPLIAALQSDGYASRQALSAPDVLPGLMVFILAIGVYSRILPCAVILFLLTVVDAGLTTLAGEALGSDGLLIAWVGVEVVFLLLYVQAVRGIVLYRRLHPGRQKKTDASLAAVLQAQLPLAFGILVVAAGAYVWGGHLGAAARSGGGSAAVRSMRAGSSSVRSSGGSSKGSSSSGARSSRTPSSSSRSSGGGGGGGGGGGAASAAAVRQAGDEGTVFGSGVDSNGCVAESLRRHEACAGPGCYSANGVFLGACLGKSTPAPGFCDSLPASGDGLASAAWLAQACAGVGRGNDHCEALLVGVQFHCESTSARRR